MLRVDDDQYIDIDIGTCLTALLRKQTGEHYHRLQTCHCDSLFFDFQDLYQTNRCHAM